MKAMNKRILTLALASIALCTNASELQAWTKGDAMDAEEQKFAISIEYFKGISENTLSVEQMYTDITYQGETAPYAYVETIGNGTNCVIRVGTYLAQYTSIDIKSTVLKEIKSKAFAGLVNVTSFAVSTTAPATVGANAFPAEWATNCALTVPAESFEAYKAAWGQYFKSINGVATGDMTPTKTPDWDVPFITARPVGRNIVLSETTDVQVYSITGASVYNGKTDNVPVNNGGVYIVKTKNNVNKVTVK